MKACSITIVGATGLVGSTLLSLLHEKKIPYHNIFLLASPSSAGKKLTCYAKEFVIQDLTTFDFSQTQLAFFCIASELAAQYIPVAVAAKNMVIDKSFCYRNHADVPLIIPEVNLHDLSQCEKMNIIANPNCNTIPIAVSLKPIYDAVGISRVNIATYQSVSGTGKEAISELHEQSLHVLANQACVSNIYPQQIAFNVLPHIDCFESNGYTREEMKMVWELQKIFSDPTLAINPTAVRVPVMCGHSAAVHIETKIKISAKDALEILKKSPGIKVNEGDSPYATPAKQAQGTDFVYVGRVREDISSENGINLWVVTDNLRKGAALNALQIADHLTNKYFV